MWIPFAFFSSPQDWGIILLVALVLFGAKRLPEMARGMGEGMKEFKKAMREVSEDEPTPTASATPVTPTPTPVAPRLDAAPTPEDRPKV